MIGSSNWCILLPALTFDDVDSCAQEGVGVVKRQDTKNQPRHEVPELVTPTSAAECIQGVLKSIHEPNIIWRLNKNHVTHTHVLFLNLQRCYWKLKSLVTQSCLTLCNPLDYSPPGSSVHGILQARILEWVAMPFSQGSPNPGTEWQGLLHGRQILYHLNHQENPLLGLIKCYFILFNLFPWLHQVFLVFREIFHSDALGLCCRPQASLIVALSLVSVWPVRSQFLNRAWKPESLRQKTGS